MNPFYYDNILIFIIYHFIYR